MLIRALRAASLVLVAVALALLLVRVTAGTAPTSVASALPSATLEPQPSDAPRTPAPSAPPIDTLRIGIARLGIDLALAYGDATRDVPRPGYAGKTPEDLALVFPGSAAIASGGNTYVYAHARTGMFLSLWKVAIGDEVVVYSPTDASARYRYRVTEIHPRVDPSDTSWLDPAGPERLTLQTSTGPTPQDPRFVVVAVPFTRSSAP